MLSTYQYLLANTQKDLADYSLAELTKIEPKGWRTAFTNYLESHYLGLDKGRSRLSLPLGGILRPHDSHLIDVTREISIRIQNLRQELHLEEHFTTAHIAELINELNTSAKDKLHPLYYFTSLDRAVAYYLCMLLARHADNFNICLVAITKSRKHICFASGLLSDKLNKRINEATEHARKPITTHMNTILVIMKAFIEDIKTLGKTTLYKLCIELTAKYIHEQPLLLAYYQAYTLSKILEHEFKELLAIKSLLEHRLERIQSDITELEKLLKDEPRMIAEAGWDKSAHYDERSVSDIFCINLVFHCNKLTDLEKIKSSLQIQLEKYEADLKPYYEQLELRNQAREKITSQQAVLCEKYYKKVSPEVLVSDLPDELQAIIETEIRDKLSSYRIQLISQLTDFRASLSPSCGFYRIVASMIEHGPLAASEATAGAGSLLDTSKEGPKT